MNDKDSAITSRSSVFSIPTPEVDQALAGWLDGERAWWLPYLPDLIEEFQVWHRQLAHTRGQWPDGYDFGDD